MKKTHSVFVISGFVLCLLLSSITNALASLQPVSPSLMDTITQSDVIVEVEVLTFQRDLNAPDVNTNQEESFLSKVHLLIKPSGIYQFRVLKKLKGQVGNTIKVSLLYISAQNYNFAKIQVEPKTKALLFLKKENSNLIPVNSNVPLIAIDGNAEVPSGISVEQQVVRLLLASMNQPELRKSNAYLLRQNVDPQVTAVLYKYIDDPDLETKDAIYYCLATNQQVSIIPYIARLSHDLNINTKGKEADSVEALSTFTTVEAVPFLNPLLFEPDLRVRTKSAYSLYNIANKTSIPYLILALRDPDPDQDIPAGATVVLHRLVPALGKLSLKSHEDYINYREYETNHIYQWWMDELNGRHLTKAKEPAPIAQAEVPQKAENFQVNLYNPSVELRRRAINALTATADKSSIPYLVLALQDPDTIVSYNAYKALHDILSLPGEVSEMADYDSHRGQEDKPIYDWWTNHLKETPVKIPDSTGFVPLVQH